MWPTVFDAFSVRCMWFVSNVGNQEKLNIDVSVHSLLISEENMTEEDEEFMLDNFVTFFIAGESLLFQLWCVKCSWKLLCSVRRSSLHWRVCFIFSFTQCGHCCLWIVVTCSLSMDKTVLSYPEGLHNICTHTLCHTTLVPVLLTVCLKCF